MGARPSFAGAWSAFSAVRGSVAEVGKLIGGRVKENIDSGVFQNACPIRMSYVLNQTGFPVRHSPGCATVSGGDGKQYIFRANDMMSYLERAFGRPDRTIGSPEESDFRDLKGIIVVKGHGWSNARGHATLWNGSLRSDTCHLLRDPDNGLFVPETASLWALH